MAALTKVETILVLGLVLFAGSQAAQKLPKSWKVCKRSDSNINKCLQTAIQSALVSLVPGLPPLGVPPMDPFLFKELKINQSGSSGPVRLDLKFTDLMLAGIKNIIIPEVVQNWDTGKLQFSFNFPNPLTLTGMYKMDGQILVLPVKGEGKCRLKFDNFKAVGVLVGKETKKGNEKFLHFNEGVIHFDTSRMTVRFEGLFNNNKELGETTDKFMNENWEVILNELKPSIALSLGEATRHVANQVFDKVALDDIAPK